MVKKASNHGIRKNDKSKTIKKQMAYNKFQWMTNCVHSYPTGHQRQTCPLHHFDMRARATHTCAETSFLHTVCNEFLPWQGRCLCFIVVQSITMWQWWFKPCSLKVLKNHDMSPPWLDTSRWKANGTVPIAWHELQGHTGTCQPIVFAVCHDFIKIVQSLHHCFC